LRADPIEIKLVDYEDHSANQKITHPPAPSLHGSNSRKKFSREGELKEIGLLLAFLPPLC
jgi:hypothetical protein